MRYFPRRTRSLSSRSVDPSKGNEPLTSVYKMTPNDQTSTSGPSYFLPKVETNKIETLNGWACKSTLSSIVYLGKAREQRMADCRKTCRACFPVWIRYWIRSRQFWYSFRYPATNSLPVYKKRKRKLLFVLSRLINLNNLKHTFRSRWIILFWWQYWTAETICSKWIC